MGGGSGSRRLIGQHSFPVKGSLGVQANASIRRDKAGWLRFESGWRDKLVRSQPAFRLADGFANLGFLAAFVGFSAGVR